MRSFSHWRTALCCFAFLSGLACAGELRMGMPLPSGSREWDIVSQGAERMANLPTGTVRIQLVAPGRNGPRLAAKIKNGTLDGGLVMMQDFDELDLGQDALAYAIPFMFKSTNEMAYIRAKLDEEILQKLSVGPYEAMAIVEFGSAYVMSSKPLADPDDWCTLKSWVPAEGAFSESLNALNWTAVSLPSKDVRKTLKSGTVDTVIVPPMGAVIKRWHTRLKNMFSVPFVYTYGIWIVSDEALARLTAEEQQTVREYVPLMCRDLSATIRERNDKARQVLDRSGIELIEPNAAMWQQWQSWADKVWSDLDAEHRPGRDIEEKLKEHLESF